MSFLGTRPISQETLQHIMATSLRMVRTSVTLTQPDDYFIIPVADSGAGERSIKVIGDGT